MFRATFTQILMVQARRKEAEVLDTQMMETRWRVFGEDNADTIVTMGVLASVYRNQGRWKEADELEVRVVELIEERFGESYLETLVRMLRLGSMYRD